MNNDNNKTNGKAPYTLSAYVCVNPFDKNLEIRLTITNISASPLKVAKLRGIARRQKVEVEEIVWWNGINLMQQKRESAFIQFKFPFNRTLAKGECAAFTTYHVPPYVDEIKFLPLNGEPIRQKLTKNKRTGAWGIESFTPQGK